MIPTEKPQQAYSSKLEYILSRTTGIITTVSVVMLLVLGVIHTLDVLATKFLDQPMTGVIKFSEASLALTLFLGVAIAVRRRSHVKVDLLMSRLGPGSKKICNIIACACMVAFLALWTYQMGLMASQSWSIREAATGMIAYPLYPVKFLLFLGLLTATFEAVRLLYLSIKKRPNSQEPQ